MVRFREKTPEQISKERYDKVLEEVNFDYEKFHDWIYDEKNKDRIEIVKLEGQDFSEATEAIFNYVKGSKQKWREVLDKSKTVSWDLHNWRMLVNEETGQIIYPSVYIDKEMSKHNLRPPILINFPNEAKPKESHASTVIFLHGTYGAINNFREIEKIFRTLSLFILIHQLYNMIYGMVPKPNQAHSVKVE